MTYSSLSFFGKAKALPGSSQYSCRLSCSLFGLLCCNGLMEYPALDHSLALCTRHRDAHLGSLALPSNHRFTCIGSSALESDHYKVDDGFAALELGYRNVVLEPPA